jgi:type III pantothenate kinase
MLLAVDIGNTSIKLGLFDGDILTAKFSVPTRSSKFDETITGLWSARRPDVARAIISSVVPEAETAVADHLRREFLVEPFLVRSNTDFGLKTTYEPLSSLGTDRLVNCFAAVEKYGGPAIVCSFGTATTIDAVSADREYSGGLIAPGMRTSARALHQLTAKLPEVEPGRPASVLGNTTVDSILSGVFFGHVAMVEGVLKRIENKLDERPKVIATGGLASLIAPDIPRIDVVDQDLTLEGLALLDARLT